MGELSAKHCVVFRKGTPPLGPDDTARLLRLVDGWNIQDGPRLAKAWRFADFASALAFVNRIGAIADAENHHPDVALAWGRVGIELWTHDAGGLTENDFILAARIDDAHASSAR